MDLVELQKNWNHFGKVDPLWAILTDPDKADNQWDVCAFFKTGVDEIQDVFRHLVEFDVPNQRRRALDFGCGVGRLTQALCPHFDQCRGIDIAPSMIGLARQYNNFGDRCEYVLNESDGLPMCEDSGWDFVYSHLVLQHMRPAYSKAYISEFLRILSPGGVLVFQLPAGPAKLTSAVADAILPDSAFRASITPHSLFFTAKHWVPLVLRVKVKNLSASVWPSSEVNPNCPMQLGNHWLNENGELLVLDDARATLERDLKSMEEAEFSLTVHAPDRPGKYILELDMVQEHIAWFAAKGSETTRVTVTVEEQPSQSDSSIAGAEPGPVRIHTKQATMEMYGVPKEEVLEAITSAGGEVLKLIPDFSAGPEWTSYFYFVTKSR